jgi:hypothetical protein
MAMNIAFKKGSRFLAVPITGEPALPSLPRMIVNAGIAAARSVRSVVTGNPVKVSPETAAKRRTICQSNVCGLYRASDRRCAKCGCPTSDKGLIDNKTEYFAEFCPLKLWGPGEIPNEPTE